MPREEALDAVVPIPLNAIAEPARGGYHRFLGWTIGQLPLPSDWHRARHSLAGAARQAAGRQDSPAAEALELAVRAAFGLDDTDTAPLFAESPCE